MAAPQRQDPLYGWFRGWGVAVMHEPLQCSKLRKFQPWDSRHRNPQQIQKNIPNSQNSHIYWWAAGENLQHLELLIFFEHCRAS